MGVYQYICEQKERNDLNGDLARQLAADPSAPLDYSSRAFQLAADEFEHCGQWTQKDAIERMNANQDVWRIINAEPRVRAILVDAIHSRTRAEYDRNRTYDALKIPILSSWDMTLRSRPSQTKPATSRSFRSSTISCLLINPICTRMACPKPSRLTCDVAPRSRSFALSTALPD